MWLDGCGADRTGAFKWKLDLQRKGKKEGEKEREGEEKEGRSFLLVERISTGCSKDNAVDVVHLKTREAV